MNQLLFYLLQVIAASGLLYGYYHFALRNKKFHRYNRFYLLMAIVISSFIPFLNIPVYFSEKKTESSVMLQTLQVISSPAVEETIPTVVQTAPVTSVTLDAERLVYLFYILAILFFFTRFIISLNKIRFIIKKNRAEEIDKIKFINTDEPGTPYSFFRWLFWNRKIELHSEKGEQIFRHELFHIQQKHSWDIIFMELISTVFWINPFFHLIKKELKAIHEFLADEFAIKENKNWQYAELLLMQVLNTNTHLVNPFFHNQIKRRIAMITTSQKPRHSYIRKLMVFPVAALIISLFAFNYKAREDSPRKFEQVINSSIDLQKSMSDTSKPLENALVIINGVIQEKRGFQNIDTTLFPTPFKASVKAFIGGKEAIEQYGEKGKDGVIEFFFDPNEKHTVDTIPKVTWIKDRPAPEKKSPTNEQLKSWENAKMYGVWVDGKRINNNDLKKYLPSAFGLYYVSKLEKNAVNYGKHYYEVCLYTQDGYNKSFGRNNYPPVSVQELRLDMDISIPNQPLIVVNGKTMPGLKFAALEKIVPVNEIESITVLKDKSATDKYGDNGRNGVIEIQARKWNPNIYEDGIVEEVIIDGKVVQDNDDKVFVTVEVEPAFPGGEREWRQFLQNNLDVDLPLKNKAPKGTYTVLLQFIVDKEGNLSDFNALTTHGYGMEEEAIRVMKQSPKWKPAMQNGRTVQAYRKQPMTFVISKDTKNEQLSSNGFDPSAMNFDDPEFKRKWREMISEIKAIAWKEGKAAYIYKGRTYVFGRIVNPDPTVASFTEQNGTDHVFLLDGDLIKSVDELNKLIKRSDVKKFGFINREEASNRFNRNEAIVFIETTSEIITKN